MASPVFLLCELSTDLKNRSSLINIMLKPQAFVAKHCIFLRFMIFEIIFIFLFWKGWLCKSQTSLDWLCQITSNRSSHPQIFFNAGDLENFTVFTKNTCWDLFFDKVALKFFIKRRLQYSIPVNIAKFLITVFGI